jgi:hypothetical protein
MDGLEQDAPVTMKMWAGCPLSLKTRFGLPLSAFAPHIGGLTQDEQEAMV